ncbi:hypothetical protein PAPYR_2631 [Paratrimastix pyriformis]|uniref:Uncharacterized protein n=1 Tax=Paratrimastix pyriformis TaxID=342808 RepID=A0ABQ8UQQ4_9EUKA|nr:hypothetical protein PAPYR_2631 [Paratrimastix pyriformis]
MGRILHGCLARAGKVRMQTPIVKPLRAWGHRDLPKRAVGRARQRKRYSKLRQRQQMVSAFKRVGAPLYVEKFSTVDEPPKGYVSYFVARSVFLDTTSARTVSVRHRWHLRKDWSWSCGKTGRNTAPRYPWMVARDNGRALKVSNLWGTILGDITHGDLRPTKRHLRCGALSTNKLLCPQRERRRERQPIRYILFGT